MVKILIFWARTTIRRSPAVLRVLVRNWSLTAKEEQRHRVPRRQLGSKAEKDNKKL
jgi:hypothetical protein